MIVARARHGGTSAHPVPRRGQPVTRDGSRPQLGPAVSLQELDQALPPEPLGDVDAALPLRDRRGVASTDRSGNLGLRHAVAGTEVAEPAAERQLVAAEAVDPRPTVATAPLVVRERNGDDQFPGKLIRHYGICRRMGKDGLLP